MADYAPKFSPGASVSYTAAAAITGGQVVYLSAAGTCALTAGASAVVLGVASRDVATGELVEVCRGGVQRCVSAAAITVGQPLKSAAAGRVTPMTIGTDPQDQLIGFALTAAGGAAVTVDVQWVK
jgi:predicted RecA/RadA family phage recombinase